MDVKVIFAGLICITLLVHFIGYSRIKYHIGGSAIQQEYRYDESYFNKDICKEEVHHLYFLKVHKSGSTTVQNLLLRFALERKLNVLTIFKGKQHFSDPYRRFDHLLPPVAPKGLVKGKYDIYCEHSIFDEEYLMTKLHTDTVNLAIIREPMSYLRSMFDYCHLAEKVLAKNLSPDPVADFLENPADFAAYATHVTHNRVATEFGFQSKYHTLNEYLDYIDSKFLVLIMEKLSESLIVMRRQLCWSMKEILYAQARQRTYAKPKINETLVTLHKAWSPQDYAFYDYFKNVMDETIAVQNNDFHGEVALFEKYLVKTREFCDEVCTRMGTLVKPYVDRESITSVLHNNTRYAESQWSSGFDVSGLDCIMMRLDPKVFRDIQKVRLFPEYCSHENHEEAKRYINPKYCEDLCEDIIPWTVLGKPVNIFTSKCY